MPFVKRYPGNPILNPDMSHIWESEAVFNGSPVYAKNEYQLFYRAQSSAGKIGNRKLEISTIGHAVSRDRVHFSKRIQFIKPQFRWERFGCEDPRVTVMNDKFYIFYTALSDWPPNPDGIKAAVAVTHNFKTVEEKHLVTPFNAKAMTLFPEKISGKLAVLVTVNPDIPPSTIAVAYVNREEDIWNEKFWLSWHKHFTDYKIPLLRSPHDHVEIGAAPLFTEKGWLLIYSYIKSYLTSHKFFTIEAALLDFNDPQKILGVSAEPLLNPEYEYELQGKIPNIVFPSGALLHNGTLGIYYGAADTSICLATCNLDELLDSLVAA